jgi:tetratricopeptide (TPR) repeat protein
MRKTLFISKLIIICWIFGCVHAFAQKTMVMDDPTAIYIRATELLEKEKYTPARDLFEQIPSKTSDLILSVNARYFSAVCAFELFHPDARQMFKTIWKQHPTLPQGKLSCFHLAKLAFRDKNYKESLLLIKQADADVLSPEQLHEYWFINGYSLYKKPELEEAKNALAHIITEEGKYHQPACFYYGYICYLLNEKDEAVNSFMKVIGHKQFGQVVPLYISQIWYKQGQYQKVTQFADTITNKEVIDEVKYLSGLSYYKLENFEKAEERLSFLADKNKLLNDSDIYTLAWCQMKNEHYEAAIGRFKQLSGAQNILGQNANYNLANCLIATGKKENARQAYYNAARLNFDKDIQEEAEYNHARLCYELLPDQAITIQSLQQFIINYPNSPYQDDAKDLLSGLFLNSKQYAKALEVLEPLPNKNNRIKTAIQKSAFCKGEELLLAGSLDESVKMFNKSLEYPLDKKFKVLAGFWLGEIAYKEGKIDKALDLYSDFVNEEGAKENVHYSSCFYNLGYCYIKKVQYAKAAVEFQKFVDLENFYNKKSAMVIDAHARLADCFFTQKKYKEAIEEYNWVVLKDSSFHDYALFQKGIIYGLQGQHYEKINSLNKLVDIYEESDYLDKAIIELGYTNMHLNKIDEALEWFELLVSKKKPGDETRRAQMEIGLIFKKQNKSQRAIEQFEFVVKKYPESEEAKEAIDILKDLYVERGEVDQYDNFIKTLPHPEAYSLSEKDSITYESALNALKTDTAKGIAGFDRYITLFPNGFFSLRVHYTRGEIYYRKKAYNNALIDYEWILGKEQNEHTERAYKNSASICYLAKEYAKALTYFRGYEPFANTRENKQFSLLGQLRCCKFLNNSDSLKVVAIKLLAEKEMPKEHQLEAHYILGGLLRESDKNQSMIHYREVTKGPKTMKAAESKYMMALFEFEGGNYIGAKKTIKELNTQYNDFEYWVAKGFLLLADLYIAQADEFQARHTLQSLIDNYEADATDPENMIQLATERLNALNKKAEEQKQKLLQEQNEPKDSIPTIEKEIE